MNVREDYGVSARMPTKEDASALRVEGLGKRFGDRLAFEDVSFEIGYGEVLGSWAPTAPARRRPCGRWAR
jgi:ABC-2 type transport system ATP-binding protein